MSCAESIVGTSPSLLHGHSQRPRQHSAFFELFHFSWARMILSYVFFSSAFILNCRKIICPDFFSKTGFQLSTTKTKNKATFLPPQFCSLVIAQDKGHIHNSFFLLSERKHKLKFPKVPVVGSKVPQDRPSF